MQAMDRMRSKYVWHNDAQFCNTTAYECIVKKGNKKSVLSSMSGGCHASKVRTVLENLVKGPLLQTVDRQPWSVL